MAGGTTVSMKKASELAEGDVLLRVNRASLTIEHVPIAEVDQLGGATRVRLEGGHTILYPVDRDVEVAE